MKRINYLVSWSERHAGIALPTAVAPALRASLAVLACSLALVVASWAVQHARLRAAERDGAEYARQLAAAELQLGHVRTVEHDVLRLRSLDAAIAEIRRSGARRASDIAALGNRIPPGAWLTSLRADRAALALEGRSTRLETVGTTLASLARLPAYGGARLISVHGERPNAAVTYAIALDPKR